MLRTRLTRVADSVRRSLSTTLAYSWFQVIRKRDRMIAEKEEKVEVSRTLLASISLLLTSPLQGPW